MTLSVNASVNCKSEAKVDDDKDENDDVDDQDHHPDD